MRKSSFFRSIWVLRKFPGFCLWEERNADYCNLQEPKVCLGLEHKAVPTSSDPWIYSQSWDAETEVDLEMVWRIQINDQVWQTFFVWSLYKTLSLFLVQHAVIVLTFHFWLVHFADIISNMNKSVPLLWLSIYTFAECLGTGKSGKVRVCFHLRDCRTDSCCRSASEVSSRTTFPVTCPVCLLQAQQNHPFSPGQPTPVLWSLWNQLHLGKP